MEPFYDYLRQAGLSVKPHQERGVRWCLDAEKHGTVVDGATVRGGFVADEMGLGKTYQMIGTCLCNIKRRTLIVLPKALLDQWDSIIRSTLGHLPVVYHGHNVREITLHKLTQAPIVLTTYGMLAERRKRSEAVPNPLLRVEWERVIFDEAHHLRNHKTAIYQGAAALSAKIRWLVTGTPIQNKRTDFYHLCAILGLPRKYYTDAGMLSELCRNFVLRRTKAEAGVHLPPLRTHQLVVKWSSDAEKKIADSALGGHQIVRLLRERQACVLPALITAVPISCQTTSKMDDVVSKLVTNKSSGKTKLVFCHFRGEIDELARRLHDVGNTRVVTFDGRAKSHEREALLSADCDVLLCQIQTCCEGLNLQQFGEIYFVSPHWNPAVEDQAVARCHRIGQTAPVDVYRFNMDDSVEDYIMNMQEVKRGFASEIV